MAQFGKSKEMVTQTSLGCRKDGDWLAREIKAPILEEKTAMTPFTRLDFYRKLTAMSRAMIMSGMVMMIFMANARAKHCERLDFEGVSLEQAYNGSWKLTVSGETPRINMDVRLVPRARSGQPNFWPVEVVGCYPGLIGIPISGYFNTTISLDDAMGRKGVAVVGATYFQKKRF